MMVLILIQVNKEILFKMHLLSNKLMSNKHISNKLKFNLAIIPLIVLSLTGCEELEPVLDQIKQSQISSDSSSSESSSASSSSKSSGSNALSNITTPQMVDAIKQALGKGVGDSIELLGKLNGFDAGQLYHIKLPEQLDKPASLLRKFGQGKKVDEVETRMNLAAKQAVSQAAPVFTEAIKDMSVQDAAGIMQGEDDAATAYFRRKTEDSLRSRFQPIISTATDETGLTSSLKSLNKSIKKISPSLNRYTVDIDKYVLDHSLNALFDRIAVEEKLIREQPLERTTDLLKTVYGYFDNK